MIRPLSGLLLCLLATGCATMVNGPNQMLSVDSFPSGSAIAVDCGDGAQLTAVTPAKIKVSRAAEHCQLTLTREGYATRVIELDRQQSRATRLNAAFGVPSAVVLGIVGALAGSVIHEGDTDARIGGEAGFDLGSGAANALDKKGGGWKWVPGDIFVVLYRSEPQEPATSD